MAVCAPGPVRGLSGELSVVAESAPGLMRHITLGAKRTGEPCAGNPHARFDRAGTGNGPRQRLNGHEAGTADTAKSAPTRYRAGPRPYRRLSPRQLLGGSLSIRVLRPLRLTARQCDRVDTRLAQQRTVLNQQGCLEVGNPRAERAPGIGFGRWRRSRCASRSRRLRAPVVRDDGDTNVNALVADVHLWTSDQLPHLLLALVAE